MGPPAATEAARRVLAAHGRDAVPLADAVAADRVTCALDLEAHRLARAEPDTPSIPERAELRARAIGAAVAALAAVGAELRRECPWDREQTAETIVPHTVEEAFEVAEAVDGGDPARIADELGDLLFQPVFLARLLEEAGDVDLAEIADGQRRKLISRHPHVYGEERARSAGAVLDVWERQKRAERADQGIFHDLPPGLPALAHATKTLKRAAAAGLEVPEGADALDDLRTRASALAPGAGQEEVGDALLAAVAAARALGADPEVALRAAAMRFRRAAEEAS